MTIDWAYWLPRLSWFGVGCLVAFVLVPLVLMWAEEQERRAYNRGWGDGYRTAWALRTDTHHEEWMHPEWPVCPDCGRDLFVTETIMPDGSMDCECRLPPGLRGEPRHGEEAP